MADETDEALEMSINEESGTDRDDTKESMDQSTSESLQSGSPTVIHLLNRLRSQTPADLSRKRHLMCFGDLIRYSIELYFKANTSLQARQNNLLLLTINSSFGYDFTRSHAEICLGSPFSFPLPVLTPLGGGFCLRWKKKLALVSKEESRNQKALHVYVS